MEILQTDFVSNVSHEFKTPLGAIEGYSTLLQDCENLTPQQREILVLREIGGLRYDEIGRQLNLEEGTVKSRIFRARKKLKQHLSPHTP